MPLKKMDFNKEVEKYLRQSKEDFNKRPPSNKIKQATGSEVNITTEKEKEKGKEKEKNMFLDDDDEEDFVNYTYKRNHEKIEEADKEDEEENEEEVEEANEDDELDEEIDDLLRKSFMDLNSVKNEIK